MPITFKLTNENIGFHNIAYGDGFVYSLLHEDKEIGELTIFIEEDYGYIDFLKIHDEHRSKGFGTIVVKEMFSFFEKLNCFGGMAKEDIYNGFWHKQDGFQFNGEMHDEYEGYFAFLIKRNN